MTKPTQFELVSLFYQAKAAGVPGSDLDVLNDIKTKWKQAADKLAAENPKEYTMTAQQISDEAAQAAADEAARVAALVATLQQEKTDELAGLNRPAVVAEINAALAALGA